MLSNLSGFFLISYQMKCEISHFESWVFVIFFILILIMLSFKAKSFYQDYIINIDCFLLRGVHVYFFLYLHAVVLCSCLHLFSSTHSCKLDAEIISTSMSKLHQIFTSSSLSGSNYFHNLMCVGMWTVCELYVNCM